MQMRKRLAPTMIVQTVRDPLQIPRRETETRDLRREVSKSCQMKKMMQAIAAYTPIASACDAPRPKPLRRSSTRLSGGVWKERSFEKPKKRPWPNARRRSQRETVGGKRWQKLADPDLTVNVSLVVSLSYCLRESRRLSSKISLNSSRLPWSSTLHAAASSQKVVANTWPRLPQFRASVSLFAALSKSFCPLILMGGANAQIIVKHSIIIQLD